MLFCAVLPASAVTVVDNAGYKVSLDSPPMRIVSFAPHITEELNAKLAAAFDSVSNDELANQDWPEHNEDFLLEDEIEELYDLSKPIPRVSMTTVRRCA